MFWLAAILRLRFTLIEDVVQYVQVKIPASIPRFKECRRACCAGFDSRNRNPTPSGPGGKRTPRFPRRKSQHHAVSKLNVPYIFFEPERITNDLNTRETALTKYNLKHDSSDYDYDLQKK